MTFEKIPRQFSSVGLGLPLVGSVSEKVSREIELLLFSRFVKRYRPQKQRVEVPKDSNNPDFN